MQKRPDAPEGSKATVADTDFIPVETILFVFEELVSKDQRIPQKVLDSIDAHEDIDWTLVSAYKQRSDLIQQKKNNAPKPSTTRGGGPSRKRAEREVVAPTHERNTRHRAAAEGGLEDQQMPTPVDWYGHNIIRKPDGRLSRI